MSARPLRTISSACVGSVMSPTAAVAMPATRDVPIAGTPYVPLALPGVLQLDLLNPEVIVMLMRDMDDGTVHMRSFPTKYL
jgi:hypothetical protein